MILIDFHKYYSIALTDFVLLYSVKLVGTPRAALDWDLLLWHACSVITANELRTMELTAPNFTVVIRNLNVTTDGIVSN